MSGQIMSGRVESKEAAPCSCKAAQRGKSVLLLAFISGLTALLSVELMADRSMEEDGNTSETGPPGISEGRKGHPQSAAKMERAAGKKGTIPPGIKVI